MLKSNLPTIHDREGDTIPKGFPTVVDAHVHIFPPLSKNLARAKVPTKPTKA